ncbi:Putative toxin subunit [Bathymodiolus thermophilus thioautotrophic gill symbiont]|uniref:RHS repeat-associated core domain-containing protein n=1 Tax=Bathymodiolus thermophilus thioautotrophic gill symbiont TaxID=2360 RepID=UPI00192CA7EC|nr:RHS repeat-associated core domain-containing protein [Bathymodiolus thermophilus thioautotrophic gill symbiont]CAB5497900.1 Putative toxin subunit [Bathymodiolus thermophilus thioautotrophic gill symbiont]
MIPLELYRQIYTYDTGNNLTRLSHQAQSNTWQQTITLHPNSNRGTENNNPNNFDANGNLSNLDNISSLNWHYNNTLSKLTKQNKTTEYYVYDHQGNRVRTVIEANNQIQSQRNYLPSLDISTNQTNTLHIGTHILAEQTKDNVQTHYQLSNHLKTNALELNDQAQVISYEHYYPYGGTAIIAGKDKTQAQQKRYRYTGKERDDSSGLYYYGARYLAPWLTRWISPDSAGSVNGLNLYVYVGNNPLKYIDPTGHIFTISWDDSSFTINTYLETRQLNLWVGDNHSEPEGKQLILDLDSAIMQKRNIIFEASFHKKAYRLLPWVEGAPDLFLEYLFVEDATKSQELRESVESAYKLTKYRQGYTIASDSWKGIALDEAELKEQGLTGGSDFLVGTAHLLFHTLTTIGAEIGMHENAFPVYWHFAADTSIALIPKRNLDTYPTSLDRDFRQGKEYGLWVYGKDGSIENAFLIIGQKPIMKSVFGNLATKIPKNLHTLDPPSGLTVRPLSARTKRCVIL